MTDVQEKWDALLDAQRRHGVGSAQAKKAQTAYRRALTAARKRREGEERRMTMVKAARVIARDRVLFDPTDDAIVLAAAELALGNWPVGGVDRGLAERIVAAYNEEEAKTT